MTDASPHRTPVHALRMEGIDALHGLVMVIMALDHSRDFFPNSHAYFDPIDVHTTAIAFFFTRWTTDFRVTRCRGPYKRTGLSPSSIFWLAKNIRLPFLTR